MFLVVGSQKGEVRKKLRKTQTEVKIGSRKSLMDSREFWRKTKDVRGNRSIKSEHRKCKV